MTADSSARPSGFDARRYKRELWGWLSYAFASEVFVIVSLTLFLPICLEQFARDNGYFLPDKQTPCSAGVSLPYSTSTPAGNGTETERRCAVKLGWVWIDTASFSLYVYSISVALQALTVISMGGIADHPPHRKRLLFTFAFLGSLSAILFFFLPSFSPVWPLSGLFAILANAGFGASVVAMNAYLPVLAKDSEGVVMARQTLEAELTKQHRDAEGTLPADEDNHGIRENRDEHTVPLLSDSSDLNNTSTDDPHLAQLHEKYNTSLSRSTSHISSLGIALGYSSGIALLALTLVPVTLLKGSTLVLRCAIGASGVWWAVFSVPGVWWLPSGEKDGLTRRNGAVMEDGENGWDVRSVEVVGVQRDVEQEWSMWREVIRAWKRLGGMLRWSEIKKLKNTFRYLGAWFLLSDGFTTITSTAILFGKTTLHMSPSSLILIGVLTPLSGILGSLLWPALQRKFGWSNLRVIVILVVMASLIPAYGCLGFLSVLREKASFGGLTTEGEMFGLAVYFGSVYGAFQSYARALYAELIPPGEEARWYGLFSITDKSSSFLGPLIVGLISDTTGNIRYAFFFLVFMIWAAVPLLVSVDVERGRKDARGYVFNARRAA